MNNSRQLLWLAAIMFVALFRMNFVSNDEIFPIKADSTNYVLQANYYLSSGTFNRLPSQLPGLSIIAMATSQMGIPFKLFLDVLLLFAGVFTFTVLRRITKSSLVGFAAFCLIALNPWFIANSKFFMTEPLTAILLVCIYLSSSRFVFFPACHWRTKHLILASLFSTVYVLTRPEFPLLACFWLMIAGVVLINQYNFRTRRRTSRFRFLLVFVPLLIACLAIQVVKQIHRTHYGVAALSCTDMSGFKALTNALYSIPPEQNLRFAPVTKQSLSAACDVSPTLKKYREKLLDTNQPAYSSAQRNIDLNDEFGTWLNWHLLGTIGVNGESNQEMQLAADEICMAQSSGQLGKRFAFFPVDPLWRQWLPELGSETMKRLAASIHPDLSDLTRRSRYVNSHGVDDIVKTGFFDSGLLRRRSLGFHSTVIRIYGQTDQTQFRRVDLVSDSNKVLDTTRVAKTRSGRYQFAIERTSRNIDGPMPEFLQFQGTKRDKDSFKVSLNDEINHRYFEVPVDSDQSNDENATPSKHSEGWRISISHQRPSQWRQLIQKVLSRRFGLVVWLLVGVAFGSGFFRRCNSRSGRIIAMASVGILFFSGRSFFYALIEVWLNWGEFRYVEPNTLLVTTTMLITAFSLGAVVRNLSCKFWPLVPVQ